MKYAIEKQLRILRWMKMPKSLFRIWISNQVLKLLYKFQKPHRGVIQNRIFIRSRDGYLIKVDRFVAKEKTSDLTLIHFHGGGFMMNATHSHKKILSSLVSELGGQAFMIHYRLAPKYAFPTPMYDVIDVYNNLIDNHSLYEIALSNFGFCGDSAGGNLAAALSLYCADHDLKLPKFQMLFYPALDKGNNTESRKKFKDTPMIYSSLFDFIGKHYYRNGLFGLENYAFPVIHPLDKVQPPTYIEVCEFDPLHDEGIVYANRLTAKGVFVVLNDVAGAVHGYDVVMHSRIVKENMKKRMMFIHEQTKQKK